MEKYIVYGSGARGFSKKIVHMPFYSGSDLKSTRKRAAEMARKAPHLKWCVKKYESIDGVTRKITTYKVKEVPMR